MIELSYDSKDAIPEAYNKLYAEKDGKFVLTGVNGMKTQTDVDNVQNALRKERELKKSLESKLNAYDGIESEGLRDQLSELARLRTTNGKVDDSRIEEIVAERIKLDQAAYETKLSKKDQALNEALEQVKNLVNEKNVSKIEKQLRDASAGKVNESAISDVLFRSTLFEVTESGKVVTKDGLSGVTPGQEPKDWLEESLKVNTHWQKTSGGVGARGGKSSTSGSSNERMSVKDLVKESLTFN